MTRRVIVILLICAVAAAAIGVALRNREPSYGGRSLGEWLRLGASQHIHDGRPSPEAVEAISQIGTNAIPFLLTRLRYERPSWQKKIINAFPSPLRVLGIHYDNQRILEMLTGFQILGEQAKGAIPELAKEAVSTNRALAFNASCALGFVGTDSIPVMLGIVTNTAAYPNGVPPPLYAAWAQLGTNARTTIPFLIAHLDDNDIKVAKTSADLLGTFGENQIEAETIVPALAKSLDSTNLVGWAALALSHFKSLARPALPSLMRALNKNPDMGHFLSRMIREIDPNALNQPIDPEIPKQLSPGQGSNEKLTNAVH